MAPMTLFSTRAGTFRVLSRMIMVCALISASCAHPTKSTRANVEARPPATAREAADVLLSALRARDGERLAALVHPVKGVRFSPSAYVNVDEDVVFSREQARAFWTDAKTYRWGDAEGSGYPIEMTPAAYADRHILDRDFSQLSTVTINEDRTLGTTRNNAADVYPAAARVEYFFEPSAGMAEGGTDWDALRLVLEPVDGTWFLIGVIRDSWSP